MKIEIITYESEEAPEHLRAAAIIRTPGAGKSRGKMVIHPVMLHAPTKEAVRIKAEEWWSDELDKAQAKKDQGSKAAATRAANAAKKAEAKPSETQDEDDGEAL